MNLLIFVYVILGGLTVLFVLYSLYKYYLTAPVGPKAFPPNSFMRQVGVLCPDYWIYNDAKKICVNQFNIPVNDPKKCYDNGNEKAFSPIEKWPINSNDVDNVLKDRCEWIRNCGPNNKLPASWLGLEDKC